ncbi:MAG TPA: class I SAM-dependent methyltransferase [Acidimicrobiales bacterium]|nr:class I SAM-dependent methyltransferase [Acidimicrobiales bacterium]
MEPPRPNYFGERVARRYDDDSADMFDPSVVGETVDFLAGLAGLAGDGAALEFAIGTGRIALPLRARGVRVHGIDLSADMLAQLARKPGAEGIACTQGDFTSTRVEGAFRLVYLVYNTIGNVTTQDAQVECFRNAAAHLEPGGCFVIEVGVPLLQRLPPGETVQVFTFTPTRIGFDELDVANQLGVSHHIWLGDDEPRRFSMPWRFVWPAELDLMARLAGMRLKERWADWGRQPFTSDSVKHVSVWEKPAG